MAEGQPTRGSGVSKRGFASMDPERQREIARKGGASVPSEKRSFSQDRRLAAEAGRKGGADGRDGGMTRQEILFHIVNHGTYHRGAIGHALDLAGAPRSRQVAVEP